MKRAKVILAARQDVRRKSAKWPCVTQRGKRPPVSETGSEICVRKAISGISHARRHFCYLPTKLPAKGDVRSSINSIPFFWFLNYFRFVHSVKFKPLWWPLLRHKSELDIIYTTKQQKNRVSTIISKEKSRWRFATLLLATAHSCCQLVWLSKFLDSMCPRIIFKYFCPFKDQHKNNWVFCKLL